jgi:hypothetical protein
VCQVLRATDGERFVLADKDTIFRKNFDTCRKEFPARMNYFVFRIFFM